MPDDSPGDDERRLSQLPTEEVTVPSARSVGATPDSAPTQPISSADSASPWDGSVETPYVVFTDASSEPTGFLGSTAPAPASGDEAVPVFGEAQAPGPRKRPVALLGGLAVLVVVVIVAGVILVSGLLGDDDSRTEAISPSESPTAASPSAAASGTPSGAPSPSTTPSGSAPAAVPVAPTAADGPQPIAAWGVKGGRGGADIGGQDLVTKNVTAVGWSGGFNGKDSEATTSGPVLDTGPNGSFTVAAAVFLVGTDRFQTAVSQDGVQNSAFYLQYSWGDKRWAFSRVKGDKPGPDAVRALSKSAPATLKWVHLVGVYDAEADRLQLYVDDKLQSTKTYDAAYPTSGKFALGRAQYGGGPADWFHGNIGDVTIYDQALTGAEVAKIPWS